MKRKKLLTRVSGPLTSIASHGLGSLAVLSTIGTNEISNSSILNEDISSSAAIEDSKLATISTAGKISGSAITSGTITGSTSFAGSGGVELRSASELRLRDNDNSHYLALKSPATVTNNITWTLPATDGSGGNILSTNGSGTLSWVSSSSSSSGTGGGAAENPNSGCPTGYILVPGDTFYGTTNFCVMKYEAKFGSKGAESRAAGLPARGTVSQTVAQASCRNLGPGYALINNSEWMTIAANVANVTSNWSGGSVGGGALNRGHSDNAPANALAAVTNDNDPCNGTGQACSSATWHDQRRTHVLSNNNVIWDLAGNVWEWVDYNNYEDKPTPATAAWTEFTGVTGTTTMPKTMLVPSNATKTWWNDSWNGATNGIGQYYAGSNSSGGALLRGACWHVGSNSGVFTAFLYDAPSNPNTVFGFRCVFRSPSL